MVRPIIPAGKASAHTLYMRIYRAKRGSELADWQSSYYAEYRAKNQDTIRAQQAVYRAANKSAIAQRKKVYGTKTAAQKAAYDAIYRKANADKIAKWRDDHPDIIANHHRNRRALEKAAEGHHSKDEIAFLFSSQSGVCVYCRKDISEKYDVDHIIPLTKGGPNWAWNLQLLCKPCNNRKRNTDPEEFERKIGFVRPAP